MKKQIILTLTACLFATVSIINMHLAQNDHNTDISLADISVMAQADGESGGSGCEVSLACSVVNPEINYIKCWGTVCSRNAAERWVECDGNRTYC